MDELIEHMKTCGWYETPAGEIGHADFGTTPAFDDWTAAIKACIEIGSGV